jgi:hypothetical protein
VFDIDEVVAVPVAVKVFVEKLPEFDMDVEETAPVCVVVPETVKLLSTVKLLLILHYPINEFVY